MMADDPFPVDPIDEPDTNGKPRRSAAQIAAVERMQEGRRAKQAAKAKASPKTTAPKVAPDGTDLGVVRTSVAEGLAKTGALVMPAMPLPGGYMIANAETAANVAARLAARHPALLASLTKASDYADYVTAGSLVFGLGVSVAVQIGRNPVDHPLSVNLGVAAVYDDMVADGLFEQPEEGTHVASENPDDRAVPVPDLLGAAPAAS